MSSPRHRLADGAHVARFAGAEAARAPRRQVSIPTVIGCAPPRTRRAVRSVVLERRHALAEIVERGAGVSAERRRVIPPILSVTSLPSPRTRRATGIVLRISDLASSKRFMSRRDIRVVDWLRRAVPYLILAK